jgi:hypothetical protein
MLRWNHTVTRCVSLDSLSDLCVSAPSGLVNVLPNIVQAVLNFHHLRAFVHHQPNGSQSQTNLPRVDHVPRVL